jgi:hypothetical protein
MSTRVRSAALFLASVGCVQQTLAADEKPAPLLISASAGTSPLPALLMTAAPQIRPVGAPASVLPNLRASFFGAYDGTSRLLFLSPLSPLRAALRVAAQEIDPAAARSRDAAAELTPVDDVVVEPPTDAAAAAKRREVILRQRRRSVLNERERDGADERNASTATFDSSFEASGLSGRLDLLTLSPGGAATANLNDSIPDGAGLVRVAGQLTDALSFALTGLAADSAATTWRAGAEFEVIAGDRNRIEVGAVYGTRFNANTTPIGGEVDRRSVGAFRVVHALQLLENVTTRMGGRFVDAPFLASARSIDPEVSIYVENAEGEGPGRSYLRFDFAGDTLFPGLEVVSSGGDLIALAEGLPVFARDFQAQRTWTRAAAAGFRGKTVRAEAKLEDQAVSHALLVLPSSISGAPAVRNGSRDRAQIASVMLEKTFADGQAQAAIQYGYGHFANSPSFAGQPGDFHQLTSRLDAFARRSGTGIAVFHRLHDGASVVSTPGAPRSRSRAQRYLVELRQNVPFVPDLLGADMAFLVSLRNVYYDDVDRRNVDEFAVMAPPRRVTGGIRVKF